MFHHAFVITSTSALPIQTIRRLFPDCTFIACVVYMANNRRKSYAVVWLQQEHTLHCLRQTSPAYIQINHQVMDYDDCQDLFSHGRVYGRPYMHLVSIPQIYGDWPSNADFWKQRVKPGDPSADAALCYYDICKTDIPYEELVQKYFLLWCRFPTWVDTCYEFHNAVPKKNAISQTCEVSYLKHESNLRGFV
jgi:hypothetical protein